MPGRRFGVVVFVLTVLLGLASAVRAEDRLSVVRARGYLGCGVETGLKGFATVDSAGRYSGFDVDMCRVVAAAIFGSGDRVRFAPAPTLAAFLGAADIDLVVRRLSWTVTREAPLGLIFGPVVFYDGQGFLVPDRSPARSPADLAGASICVESGLSEAETWPRNLAEWAASRRISIDAIVFQRRADAKAAFLAGRCAAYSADLSLLSAIRADAADPAAYRILPGTISKEPLAPLMRAGDDSFFQVVRWSLFAAMDAEELGIGSGAIDSALAGADSRVRSLLGVAPGAGRALGLTDSFAVDIIRSVGNYGEIYARNLGPSARGGLERGLNRLWTEGGLIYAPPVR